MTWTWSGDPASSDRDEVRFLLQDTDVDFQLLQDEEIDWLITSWGPAYDSNTMVAAVGAAVIARKFAGLVSVSADGVEVDVSGLTDRYTAMAEQLRSEYAERQDVGGSVDMTSFLTGQDPDPSIKPLAFGMGMHDNPEAGQQDYGGWGPPAWLYGAPLLPGAEM